MRHIQGRRWAVVGLAGAMLAAGLAGAISPARAANDSFYFTQTRHTVSGAFWAYWQSHGGLAQQGYPISEEFQETGADGKLYTVQYFERAVFEKHPENKPPYDVLLAPLGTAALQARYPDKAPAGQWVNPDGARAFPQTGHAIGGGFLAYWQSHGGLAQYGLPLTDEFQQQSAVDGKTYTMQYFERAVFELHPDAPAGYQIMLSLLGSLRYHDRYEAVSNPRPVQWAPAPGLAPATAPVLLNATFASADLSAWQPIPTLDEPATWQMLNGHLQQAGDVNGDTKDQETVLLAGSPAWRNIQLEAQIIATSGDPVGVVWRATDTSYYRLTLLPALPNAHWKAAVERVDKGKATTLVSAPPEKFAGYDFGKWLTVRVVAQGARQQIFINGVAVLDAQDSALAQGQVGVYTTENGAAGFDNIRVLQLP